jgi:hypothetical protein
MDALAARTVVVRTNDARAYGKVAWSWPPDAEAKPCGYEPRGDRGKKARSLGRARRKPLKPLRRECRMIWLNLWYLPPDFFIAGGPWVAASTRHSLRPPIILEGEIP